MAGREVARWLLLGMVAASGLAWLTESVLDATLRWRRPPPGELVDVGGGRRLHLDCEGEGDITFLMVHGLGGSSVQWTLVREGLGGKGRVCAVDRAGYGWSDASPGDGTAQADAADLDALLDAAGLPTPLVVVAHSFGAYVARALVARRPDAVSGLVLIDPAHPAMLTSTCDPSCLTPVMRDSFRRFYAATPWIARFGPLRLGVATELLPLRGPMADLDPATRGLLLQTTVGLSAVDAAAEEVRDWDVSAAAVAALPPTHDLPVRVLYATEAFGPSPGVDPALVRQIWRTLESDHARLYPGAAITPVQGADHHSLLYRRQPDVAAVVAMIEDLAREVRGEGAWDWQ